MASTSLSLADYSAPRHSNWSEFIQTSGFGFGTGAPKLPSALSTSGQRLWGRSISREIRVGRACVATLRFALTGPEYSEAFVNGELNWANASRGWLTTGAFARTGNGGTTVS